MRIKLLRRLCADEVKLLLERMDSSFDEEFGVEDSKWDPVVRESYSNNKYFTKIERFCIKTEFQHHLNKAKRAKAYQEILKRAMSPAKYTWEYNRERDEEQGQRVEAMSMQPKQMIIPNSMYQAAQGLLQKEQVQAQYNQQQIQSQYAQNQVSSLHNYMSNLSFEMRGVGTLEAMQLVTAKHRALMDLEQEVIKHQDFLKKHAPKGYI